MEFITTLHRRVSFRNGCYRRILCIEGSIYFFGYWLRVPRRPTESVRTKFGLMRSGKGGIILEEDSTEWNNSAIKRPRASTSISVSFLFWRVNELQRMIKNILCLHFFSLDVFKIDLYLLKQSIFRALKSDLERAYLMIKGQSSHFTSCY